MPSKPTLPKFRPFQLATLVKEVPAGDDWLFETKFDGYRCQAAVAGKDVRLYSRNGHDWSEQFAGVAPPLRALTTGSALVDGEVIAVDQNGRSDFSALQRALHGGGHITFFAFDLLELDGNDLTRLPQVERKDRLAALLGERDPKSALQFSTYIVGHGKSIFQAMCASGEEGVIAKRPNARYISGDRGDAWLKVKCIERQEFVIVGWRPDEVGGKHLRSLILATHEEGGLLLYRGRVGTGFSGKERDALQQVLVGMAIEEPKVSGIPKDVRRFANWVRPDLVAEVEFTELTADGTLRHPSFKGIREDKSAAEVTLEEPNQT